MTQTLCANMALSFALAMVPYACEAKTPSSGPRQAAKGEKGRSAPLLQKPAHSAFAAPPLVSDPAYVWGYLYEDNLNIVDPHLPTKQLQPASLAKYMTAYVVFSLVEEKKIALGEMIEIPRDVLQLEDSKFSGVVLKVGQSYPLGTLIQLMVAQSNNWAAYTLAKFFEGSEEKFVEKMNVTAKTVGQIDSLYTSASGLPSSKTMSGRTERTTAQDMLVLAARLYQDFPQYRHYLAHDVIDVVGKKIMPTLLRAGLASFSFDMAKTGSVNGCRSLITSKEVEGRQVFTVVMCDRSAYEAHHKTKTMYDTIQGAWGAFKTNYWVPLSSSPAQP
jgi:D-alanyl-D-alanine carboxypeptidase